MRNERVLAALPSAVREWLSSVPESSPLWQELGRDVAVRIGRELLAFDGEAVDPGRRAEIARGWSPTAATIARHVPPGHRRWSANRITGPICAYFELWGAADDVRRRMTQEVGETVPSHDRTTPTALRSAA